MAQAGTGTNIMAQTFFYSLVIRKYQFLPKIHNLCFVMQMLLNVGTQNSGFFSDNEIFTHILQKKKKMEHRPS